MRLFCSIPFLIEPAKVETVLAKDEKHCSISTEELGTTLGRGIEVNCRTGVKTPVDYRGIKKIYILIKILFGKFFLLITWTIFSHGNFEEKFSETMASSSIPNISKVLLEGDDFITAIERAFYFEPVSYVLKKFSFFGLTEEDIA
ncbi:hypothetical protein RhiirA4_428182 [Rhizophagus irregularis]|uniref:Uncharacterized protein n=1 Tax=Rhizophagus irregularis TaxID=588596 RepID=A0A2I1HBT4_9GLOM|nr:hypothetical protein RhiirA4_428182 [Rhizophagus irregularis]